MANILIRKVDETDYKKLQEKAAELGLSTTVFIRQILKDYLKKSNRKNELDAHKAHRASVHVLAEAFGRTQGASPEATEKLKKMLLKIFDQEVQ